MKQSAATTIAIILGAHEWPKHPSLDTSSTFLSSANWFTKYFCSPQGMGLRPEAILDLFDSESSPDQIDTQLGTFLENRIRHLRDQQLDLTDVLLYYCGHGGFSERDDKFLLSLKSTRQGFAGVSSYRMMDVARTLNTYAGSARRFIILDCCYAAAGAADFFPLSDGTAEMTRQAILLFPPRGTALLCAASANIRAKAARDSQYTMFSGALIEALEKGNPRFPPYASIRNLKDMIARNIQARYSDRGIAPEVQVPEAAAGDIAEMPLFPNPGNDRPYDAFFFVHEG
jgi:hypothetical protein